MRTIEEIRADIEKFQKQGAQKQVDKFWLEWLRVVAIGIEPDRLEELCNAEHERRCVLLPFEEGTEMYEVRTIFGEPRINAFVFDRTLSAAATQAIVDSIGKTVFLTPEAAECALKGRESNG